MYCIYLHDLRLKRSSQCIILTFLLLSLFVMSANGQTKNGFDLSKATIDASKIKEGGPPRGGIPSLDDPPMVSAEEATYLKSSDRILGIEMNGMAKAYPIRILNWHEIVNDDVGGEPVLVSYCPLCGSGMAFNAHIKGKALDFGVSGLLYNNDVLMYDRQTESLWPQLMAKAISGPLKGTHLEQLPITHTSWKDWSQQHPETKVLSINTGYDRDYSKDPYEGYENSNSVYFPVSNSNNDYRPKDLVMAVIQEDVKIAYPFPELRKSDLPFEDTIGGKRVRVHYDEKHRTGKILTAEGEQLPTVTLYWFAWAAFYPDAEVYKY